MNLENNNLLGPVEIKQIAGELNLKPTKTLGQNFVHDANTVKMIIKKAEVNSEDIVLEIGPGLGSLTLGLIKSAKKVYAVEIDSRLAKKLPETITKYCGESIKNLTIINKDAMKINNLDFGDKPNILVANLPYNVSVPLIIKILKEFPSIEKILVMVQKEVAERLAAEPGTKNYGIPSLKANYFGEVKNVGKISKQVFWPIPKVESALILIDRHKKNTNSNNKEFLEKVFLLIDTALGQRRKTLRSALQRLIPEKEKIDQLLQKSNIKENTRGEELKIDSYIELAKHYN